MRESVARPKALARERGLAQNEIVFLLCVGELLLAMGLGFLSPILPKFVQSLGVKPEQIGIAVGTAVTVYGIARAGMDLPAGKIARRFGRRFLLVGGPALVAVSALGMALATNAYWQLIFWRVLQGAGTASFGVTAIIVLGEISTSANRGLNMSFLWGAYFIGSSLGPGFGGFLGEFFGYRAAFFCYAGLAILATLWGYLRIPETSPGAAGGQPGESCPPPAEGQNAPPEAAAYDRNFFLVSLVAFITMITVGGTQVTLVPLIGYESLLLREGQVGLSLTVIAAVQLVLTPLAGRLSDLAGRKKMIVAGSLVASLGLYAFVRSGTYWLFLLSALVLGVGRGLSGPVPTAYVVDIAAPKGDYEGMLAAFRAISDLGLVIGPVFCGFLKDAGGISLPVNLTAGMLFLVTVLFGFLGKEPVRRGETGN
jgi:MFS family permease